MRDKTVNLNVFHLLAEPIRDALAELKFSFDYAYWNRQDRNCFSSNFFKTNSEKKWHNNTCRQGNTGRKKALG